MNFVWLLGSGSNFENEEIRYSIRSVLKHHPNANITIIGEKPDWYAGEYHFVADDTGSPYLNTWKKALKACKLFREWVVMNDDFYLMAEYRPAHYYSGALKDHVKNVGNEQWGQLVKSTYRMLPSAKRWTMHVPTPIYSERFVEVSKRYEGNVISWKAMYCENENRYERIELKRDVKIRGTIRREPKQFFSIANNFGRNREWFQRQYPDKNILEKG